MYIYICKWLNVYIYIFFFKTYIYIYIYPQTLCLAVAKIVIRPVRNLLLVRAKCFFSIFKSKICAFWPAATNVFEHVHFAWQAQCFVTLRKLFVAFSLAVARNRVFLDGPVVFVSVGGLGGGAIITFLQCRPMMLRSWLSSLDVNTLMMLRSWLSSVDAITSMMPRSWHNTSLDVNTLMMLRSWLPSLGVITSMMLRSWLSSRDVSTPIMLSSWLSSVDVNTSMMLRSWLSAPDVNRSMMLRSWLSSVDVNMSMMLRFWLLLFSRKDCSAGIVKLSPKNAFQVAKLHWPVVNGRKIWMLVFQLMALLLVICIGTIRKSMKPTVFFSVSAGGETQGLRYIYIYKNKIYIWFLHIYLFIYLFIYLSIYVYVTAQQPHLLVLRANTWSM